MTNMRRRSFAVLLTCALCAGGALAPAGAWAAEGDYLLKAAKVYRVDGGKERLLEDAEPQRQVTDAGLFSWILVDPEAEGMEGSESGIYLFLGEDRSAGFLPMKDAGSCMVELSPSGEKMLTSCGEEIKQDIGVYLVDAANKSFIKKKSLVGRIHPFWIDAHRFLFTAIDESKGLRGGAEDAWWYSAALYDTAEDELIVLKEATETRSYMVAGCDHDEGMAEISEASVKDEKDWANVDKIEYEDISVPIPAAG